MKRFGLLGMLVLILISAFLLGCTQPEEIVCATDLNCKCVMYTVEPGAVYAPAKFCGLENGIKECKVVGEECKEMYVTEEDLKDYCGSPLNQFSALYTCKDGYFKIVYNNIGGGIKFLKPGQQAVECPVVAPDAMSEECKKMLEEGFCSEENLCGDIDNGGNGAGIANPAAVYCEEQGGTLRNFNGIKGVVGVCGFTDGSACKQWDYYNGECSPGDCHITCEAVGTGEGWNLVCAGGGEVLELTNCSGDLREYCQENDGTPGVAATCEFEDGSACKQIDYFEGRCSSGDCKIECSAIGSRSEGWYLVCDMGPKEHRSLLVYTSCSNQTEEFCGSSTLAECQTNQDCKTGGCSGQVCEGQDEDTVTTCEYLPCYSATSYNLTCQCIENQCKWA